MDHTKLKWLPNENVGSVAKTKESHTHTQTLTHIPLYFRQPGTYLTGKENIYENTLLG